MRALALDAAALEVCGCFGQRSKDERIAVPGVDADVMIFGLECDHIMSDRCGQAK